MYVKYYEYVRSVVEALPLGIPQVVDTDGRSVAEFRRNMPAGAYRTRVVRGKLTVTRYNGMSAEEYKAHVKGVIKRGECVLEPRMNAQELVIEAGLEMKYKVIYHESSHTISYVNMEAPREKVVKGLRYYDMDSPDL